MILIIWIIILWSKYLKEIILPWLVYLTYYRPDVAGGMVSPGMGI